MEYIVGFLGVIFSLINLPGGQKHQNWYTASLGVTDEIWL